MDPDPDFSDKIPDSDKKTRIRNTGTKVCLFLIFVEVLGDLSMTLCDPFAINFLSQSAMKLINHQVSQRVSQP